MSAIAAEKLSREPPAVIVTVIVASESTVVGVKVYEQSKGALTLMVTVSVFEPLAPLQDSV